MRVCLVYPPYGTGKRSKYFPFGLAYVAAALRDSGNEVTVVDMEACDMGVDEAVSAARAARPDLVGFGGMVTRYRIVKEVASAVRKAVPDAFLVAGNTGATTMPDLYLKGCGLDAVVAGEGEGTAVELVRALDTGGEWRDVPGLGFLDGGRLHRSATRAPVEDLDSLPWPAWDLFPTEEYVNSFDHRQKLVRHLEVVASRGCPFSCVYCYRIYGRKVRRRSAASIVAELEELAVRYRIEYTGFPDDLFTSEKTFVMETCRLMREKLPGLRWSCLGRVNTVDAEMLAEMARSGCDWISYGIESGSDEMLRAMNRGVSSETCLEAIRLTRRAGIHADGSFMIGMYGETRKTVLETVDFCRRADMTAPMLFVTPYPGTAIFDRAASDGRIPSVEEFVSGMNAADRLLVNLTDMSDAELIALRDEAQTRIGWNYLLRRPFARIPSVVLAHLRLRGFRGIVSDICRLPAIVVRRHRKARTREAGGHRLEAGGR